jgi:hypothetical protein
MVKVPFELQKAVISAKTARINAAGGEYESFQVLVTGGYLALKGVRWQATDLEGETGKIAADNIQFNPVGYVETTVKSEHYKSSLGWWPDPLLRMDSFDVSGLERQPLWVTVYVPTGTPAGTYRGNIEIQTANAGNRTIPIELRVWGFDIPQRSSIKTLTWVGSLENYGGNSRQNRKAFYELLLQHRLGPGGKIELDEDMLNFTIERGMNAFILEIIPNLKRLKQSHFSQEYKDRLQTRLQAHAKRFGQDDTLDGMAYIYNYDEVGRDHWPLAKDIYTLIKNVSSKFNVIQCLNIPEGVEALAGYADTWDVYVAQYKKSGVEQRVAKGDEAWLAVCCYPVDRPNFFLEYPAIDGRMLGWICYLTGVSGFEYWKPNHWKGNDSSPGLRGGWKANTFSKYNGDGYLTYPGPDPLPLSSVRLANFRDGFEDYEYLHLLKELGGDTEVIKKVVSTPTKYTSDPRVLSKTREEIAKMIELKKKNQ